jgi:probable rRNA maturation factor
MPSASKKIRFYFLQRNFSLADRSSLKRFVEKLFKKEEKVLQSLNYIFCSDAYLLSVNRQYLQHDFYTDILTFDLSEPGQPINAEIYISVDRVRDNANNYDSSFKKELHRVIFHGALHLCGYKDKKPAEAKIIRKMEDKYMDLYLG